MALGALAAVAAAWQFSLHLNGASDLHGVAAVALVCLSWTTMPVAWWAVTGFPAMEAARRTKGLRPRLSAS